jgi:CRISPR/Cas system-associated exonuclease Cas4 (RecB family)
MKQYIHISDINAFLQCRRAWNFSSNLRQHLTTKIPYQHFYFGTVVHKFLEMRYSQMINPRQDAINELLEQPNHIREFIDFGAQLYDHFHTWQASDNSEYSDRNFIRVSTEQAFDVPILTPTGFPSSKFRFAGRVDGAWRSRLDGKLYLHEIKTTSSIDSRIGQLQFEYQPTAYMLAMAEVYGEPIAGVVYTLIRKKLPADPDILKNGMLSKNKGIDTTADHYLACARAQHGNEFTTAQIKSEYGDILSTLLNQPNRFFRRILVKRSDAQLAEMRRVLYDVARDMTNRHLLIYPSPSYFCGNCIFQAPCVAMSNGQPIDPILTAHYTRNTRLD